MRVEIERDAPTKRWKVWVIQDLGGPDAGSISVMTAAGDWEGYELDPPKPTWVIDDEVWRPLVAAILGLPPGAAPLADALTDARVVRDRMIALVEQAFPLNLIAPREEP